MELRKYNEDTPQYNFYKEMHKNQTLEFVENQREKYSIMNNKKITSLCVFNKKSKLKTIGVIHIHTILQSNIT